MGAIIGRKTTWRRRIGNDYITAEYGFSDLNQGRGPFGVTASMWNVRDTRSEGHSFGCLHDQVARAFPELRPLIPWHGMMTDGPMHYGANAAYWYEFILGISEWDKPGHDPMSAFKSTVVFGALPDDEETLAAAMAEPFDRFPEANTLAQRRHDAELARLDVERCEAAVKEAKRREDDCLRAVATVEAEYRKKRSEPIRAWCERRKPALMAKFVETMKAFKLWEV